MPVSRPTAVVITTFDVESLAVTAHLDESREQRQRRDERGTLYEIGTFTGEHGVWTVAVAEIGPGNSTAGVEVERAITAFAPEVILLVGVAGGLKDLGLGDVVAADAVYDYESGKDTDDDYVPRIKTQSSSHRLLQHARLVARHAQWQLRIRPAGPSIPPRAVVKPVAAGSKLVAGDSSRTAGLLRRCCSDAVAVEMEGHGFLRGAYLNHTTEALVVRGVSDLLSGKDYVHDEQWQPIAARHAAAFAFAVLDSVRRTVARPGSTSRTSADVPGGRLISDAAEQPAAEEPPQRRRRLDWNWIVTASGPVLALAVVFFTPALPYQLTNPFSVLLLLASTAAVLWVIYKVRQWQTHPRRERPRGMWAAATAAVVSIGFLLATAVPQEEKGYGSAHCPVGLWGYGYGTVWIKVQPKDTDTPHEVIVRWGGWTGRPDLVELDETTYFTVLKRDWRSGPMDVLVYPPATITCGDGRPPPDRPTIHIDGSKWKLEPRAPSPTTSPTPSPSRPQPDLVQDGGDPTGCAGDARRVHQQPVFTPAGARLGTLELIHSLRCKALWGRLQITPESEPPDGWKVTLTLTRAGDGKPTTFERHVKTTAFYTGALRDDGSCFTVEAVVTGPQGDVRPSTPCLPA